MSSLGIGLIGCGAASKRYYVPALKEHPEIHKNLILVDKNLEQAKELSTELGGVEITDDYHKLLGKVQGVIIVVPNQLHYSIAMKFLKYGVHVLCEKPLADSVQHVKAMVHEAKKNNVSLLVNNTRRMFPSFAKIKELISNAKIGRIVSIKYFEGNTFAWPSLTGFYVDPKISDKGVLLDIGAHVLDLVCWWLDGKPKLVSYEDDSFGGPESVAYINAKKDKCEIEIWLNRLNDLDNLYKISGEFGYIEGEIFDWEKINIVYKSGKTRKIKIKTKAKTYPDFVKPIVNNFINILMNNEKPIISGEDVINSIDLIEECYSNRKRFNMPWYENLEAINVL